MKTLITHTHYEIGQMKDDVHADEEVNRMNKQDNTTAWHKDYSDQMYVEDETDLDVHNPCMRQEGNCFITRSTEHVYMELY